MRIHGLMVFTAAALLGGSILINSATAAPALVIDEPTFNFGYAPQNSELSHVFWLHSGGDDALKILEVVPGCGCTKAPLDKDVLSPGDSTALEVIFSTRNYRNQVSKQPRIKTNEGSTDKHVQFVANIVARPDSTYPLIFTPYKLDLSQFGDKQRNEVEFSIENASAQEVTVQLVSTADAYFGISLPKTIAPGATASGKLTLRKTGAAESFAKSFTVEVNDRELSRFTVPVKRTIHNADGSTVTSNAH